MTYHPHSSVAQRLTKGIKRLRFLVIAFWLAVVVLGLVFGLRFLDATVSDFPAPKGSPSRAAAAALVEYFPEQEGVLAESLLLKARDGQMPVNEGELGVGLARLYRSYAAAVNKEYGEWLRGPVLSYYLLEALTPELAAPLLAQGNASTLFIVSYVHLPSDRENIGFITFLLDEANKLLDEMGISEQVEAGLTGLGAFGVDITQGVKDDSATMDTIVLPLALLILACVLRSLPLLLLPLLTIPVTLLGQFLVMYPVALAVDVVSFAPTVMLSLSIAMGIDYSLFMLTRFMDGLRAQKPLQEAVVLMLESAGYIILVSGSTLCVSFLGLVFLPMEILRSLGLGASVAILTALLVNLTLVPALLFVLGPYLLRLHAWLLRAWARGTGCLRRGRRGMVPTSPIDTKQQQQKEERRTDGSDLSSLSSKGNNGDDGDGGLDAPLLLGEGGEGYECDESDPLTPGCWLGLARFVSQPRKGLLALLLVTGLSIPVLVQLKGLQTSVEFDLMLPYGSGSYNTLEAIEHDFGGAGVAFPYKLLFVDRSLPGNDSTPINTALLSPLGYQRMHAALAALVTQAPPLRYKDVTGIMALNGEEISYGEMARALVAPNPDSRQFTLQTLRETTASSDAVATFATLTLPIDPYSPEGQTWVDTARGVLRSLEQDELVAALDLHLDGPAAVIHDAVGSVLDAFPTMVSITLAVVFLLIGLAYRSVVAPLRSVLTIALTLGVVYGLAILVYQHGGLDALGVRSLSQVGSIAWLPIVMCFSIIVGLGLDYDVFLITRILEYRLEGHTERGALVRGVVNTGHIITAAGVIMAVAFSGLLFSSELILNQTAFLLMVSVLLDTFLIRAVVVPILMTLTGPKTWWPRKDLPEPTKDVGVKW